ncbi:DtxR family iron (metal) dependent repressor [Thermodesulfitimonas autotrophica]|uniref:DtxR family iron (Metal) dependent repressor n=1 Tax=Thermodesulfitimonas autotrophica TaxID=1894989 RepID=A0A3N5AD92_9THEO|nr:metal-dependent transcriptional regulator [Thermodesulfitimonas autotrophica]RPF42574.1 DtxR family iron (metal) dependent repressor [Thermodesulfitimonas autotrophica]
MKKEGGFSPALEDYLEAILELADTNKVVRVTDIAARLGIAKPSVAQALGHLKRLGLVTQERYGPVWLTEEGRAQAAEVRRRHRALFYFLTAVLGVPASVAERDACRMEHVISSQTMDRLLAFLVSNRWVPEGEMPAASAPEAAGDNGPKEE